MNTEKVFIGFNTSGKEILVYKKDDGTYINLLSKDKRVEPTINIQLPSLMPYNKVMKTFKHKREKSVVKKYKLNRSKMLDIKDIKIGSVCSMYNTVSHPLSRDTFENHRMFKTLFIEHFIRYEDIIDGNRYHPSSTIANRHIYNGNLYAEIDSDNNLITSNLIESNNRYIEKKKAIELAYKLRNSK